MTGSGLWGVVVIGGPILFVGILIWVLLNNRQSRAEKQRTEDATRQLYAEQDAIDKAANSPKSTSAPAPAPKPLADPALAEPPAENISTLHQQEGDARRPSDTLDRPGGNHPAHAWEPGRDEGRSSPGPNSRGDV